MQREKKSQKRVLLKNKAGEGVRDLQGGGGTGDRTVQTYIRKISRNMRFQGFQERNEDKKVKTAPHPTPTRL